MSVAGAFRRATAELERAGIESPIVDAELLLAHVLGSSRTAVHARVTPLTTAEAERLDELVARRACREPLAYVLGEWGFRRLVLKADRRALVPRPETEIVVERCLALLADVAEPRVLDLGTGSGAIALALVDEHPGSRVVAVDSSPDALALARENVALVDGAAARVELRRGEFASPPGFDYDLVVSNPPYVLPDQIESLEPEVRDWEPRAALVSEDATEQVVATALQVLRPGGWLVVETAADGAAGVRETLLTHGYRGARITRDLAGRERVVEGQRP